MKNPSDVYSHPLSVTQTKLATLFHMQARENPDKPGRSLRVAWDKRVPLVKDFENNYSYIVTFAGKGNVAGNHFHKKKHELFVPIIGDFIVLLEGTVTHEKEELSLSTNDYTIISVKPSTAHSVIAKSDIAVLLVVASSPNVEEDEFPFEFAKPR